MRYDHERREDWVRWYLGPEGVTPWDLRAALQSVPPQHWGYVAARLRTALSDPLRQPAGAGGLAAAWKAALFGEEAAARSTWSRG